MSKLAQDGDVNKEDGELIFNPYNERNIEITEDEVCDILKKYGIPDKGPQYEFIQEHSCINLIVKTKTRK